MSSDYREQATRTNDCHVAYHGACKRCGLSVSEWKSFPVCESPLPLGDYRVQATMIIRHSVGDEYLHPLLEQRIAEALLAAHNEGLEAGAVIAPDAITFTALIDVLQRLRSKNRNPNREWYEGWNAAIDCLLADAKARTAAAKGETPGNEAHNQ